MPVNGMGHNLPGDSSHRCAMAFIAQMAEALFLRMSTVAADASEDGSAPGVAGSAALVLVATDASQKSNRIPIWI